VKCAEDHSNTGDKRAEDQTSNVVMHGIMTMNNMGVRRHKRLELGRHWCVTHMNRLFGFVMLPVAMATVGTGAVILGAIVDVFKIPYMGIPDMSEYEADGRLTLAQIQARKKRSNRMKDCVYHRCRSPGNCPCREDPLFDNPWVKRTRITYREELKKKGRVLKREVWVLES